MTQPGIEPRSPGPLANTPLVRPMARLVIYSISDIEHSFFMNIPHYKTLLLGCLDRYKPGVSFPLVKFTVQVRKPVFKRKHKSM